MLNPIQSYLGGINQPLPRTPTLPPPSPHTPFSFLTPGVFKLEDARYAFSSFNRISGLDIPFSPTYSLRSPHLISPSILSPMTTTKTSTIFFPTMPTTEVSLSHYLYCAYINVTSRISSYLESFCVSILILTIEFVLVFDHRIIIPTAYVL